MVKQAISTMLTATPCGNFSLFWVMWGSLEILFVTQSFKQHALFVLRRLTTNTNSMLLKCRVTNRWDWRQMDQPLLHVGSRLGSWVPLIIWYLNASPMEVKFVIHILLVCRARLTFFLQAQGCWLLLHLKLVQNKLHYFPERCPPFTETLLIHSIFKITQRWENELEATTKVFV